jgi:hypothetical protein
MNAAEIALIIALLERVIELPPGTLPSGICGEAISAKYKLLAALRPFQVEVAA